MYFKHSVAARYESTEREAKHLRFAQAAVQIRQRLRLPEQMAIPGVGLPPPVSYRWDWWTESPPRGFDPEFGLSSRRDLDFGISGWRRGAVFPID